MPLEEPGELEPGALEPGELPIDPPALPCDEPELPDEPELITSIRSTCPLGEKLART